MKNDWVFKAAKMNTIIPEIFLVVSTVQVLRDFRGKYNAKNFSMAIMTSKAEE